MEAASVAAGIAILFFCITFFTQWHHEMWRDELQAWRLAANSASLSDLLAALRYEGHPAVWYLCLYVLSRFSDDPFLMQVFHLTIATSAIYLFARFSPFTKLQKILFACGYLMIYEYAVLSRSYVMGVFALFLYCVLRRDGRLGAPSRVVILAIAMNTNWYAAIIAFALGMVEVYECMTAPLRQLRSPKAVTVLVTFMTVAAGMLVLLMQTIPPPDSSPIILKLRTLTDAPDRHIADAIARLWKGYVPIPKLTVPFWNSNVLDTWLIVGRWHFSPVLIQDVLSVGLLAWSVWLLSRTPAWLLVYTVSTLALFTFMHLKYYGGTRHAGHFYIVLIVCLWLSRYSGQHSTHLHGQASLTASARTASFVLTVLFCGQTIGAILALYYEIRFPFSNAQEVARYVHERGLADAVIIGSEHHITSSVGMHLNRPMYFAESDQVSPYVIWKAGRHHVTPEEIIHKAEELGRDRHKDVVVVSSYDLGEMKGLIKLRSFNTATITSDERYFLYRTATPDQNLRNRNK